MKLAIADEALNNPSPARLVETFGRRSSRHRGPSNAGRAGIRRPEQASRRGGSRRDVRPMVRRTEIALQSVTGVAVGSMRLRARRA